MPVSVFVITRLSIKVIYFVYNMYFKQENGQNFFKDIWLKDKADERSIYECAARRTQ